MAIAPLSPSLTSLDSRWNLCGIELNDGRLGSVKVPCVSLRSAGGPQVEHARGRECKPPECKAKFPSNFRLRQVRPLTPQEVAKPQSQNLLADNDLVKSASNFRQASDAEELNCGPDKQTSLFAVALVIISLSRFITHFFKTIASRNGQTQGQLSKSKQRSLFPPNFRSGKPSSTELCALSNCEYRKIIRSLCYPQAWCRYYFSA